MGASAARILPRTLDSEISERRPAEAATALLAETRKLRVLVVDDDILVSMGAADMLLDLGHSVTEAASGAAALKLMETEAPFDVVVTDYAMPGMNGRELAARIQRINSDLPIVIATGYAELPADQAAGFERLAKPYTQAELAAALEAALKRVR